MPVLGWWGVWYHELTFLFKGWNATLIHECTAGIGMQVNWMRSTAIDLMHCHLLIIFINTAYCIGWHDEACCRLLGVQVIAIEAASRHSINFLLLQIQQITQQKEMHNNVTIYQK